MAWLLALAVIAGASPVMAASNVNTNGPSVSQLDHPLPAAPFQAALDEVVSPFIEDESTRRVADHGDSDPVFVVVAADPAAIAFGLTRDAHAEPRSWLAASLVSSCHKTGPPAA